MIVNIKIFMVVLTSKDRGKTWKPTKTTGTILVITPGAGTYANRGGYERLQKNMAGKYKVVQRTTATRLGGYAYPPNWESIMRVDLTCHPPDSLVGLARAIGSEIRSGSLVPDLIICGSRGGQVVLPMLVRHFWQGPFIAMNAGPLTSKCTLPRGCVAWFITCGRDYFKTRDTVFVETRFASLSSARGHNIRLTYADHMPNLNNALLSVVSDAALHGTSVSKWSNAAHTYTALSPVVSSPLLTMTVESHSSASRVLLRWTAQSAPNWYVDKRAVSNGEKVSVAKQDVDEKGYEMLYVETPVTSGWLYAINIAELQ